MNNYVNKKGETILISFPQLTRLIKKYSEKKAVKKLPKINLQKRFVTRNIISRKQLLVVLYTCRNIIKNQFAINNDTLVQTAIILNKWLTVACANRINYFSNSVINAINLVFNDGARYVITDYNQYIRIVIKSEKMILAGVR
jgi:hypothetical protein